MIEPPSDSSSINRRNCMTKNLIITFSQGSIYMNRLGQIGRACVHPLYDLSYRGMACTLSAVLAVVETFDNSGFRTTLMHPSCFFLNVSYA